MIESEAIDVRAGDVHITPEQIGDVNIGTYGSEDYVLSTGNSLKAELITNNTVRVFDGVMVYGGIRDAIPVNKYYDITISNGSQGKNRNDVIVRRYTKDDDSQKKARAVFAIVKGTPNDGSAIDPDIEMTDIRSGALTHDMPLHRVRLEGLNIVAVEPLFNVLMPMSEQQKMLADLNSNKISGFGATESITLPYTAKSDGILQIYASAKTAGSAYYYIRIGGRAARLQIQSGGVTSASFPVHKGEKVEIEETNNIGTVALTYIPFL